MIYFASFFLFFKIYGCVGSSLLCTVSGGYSLVVVLGLLIVVAFPVAALGAAGFSI